MRAWRFPDGYVVDAGPSAQAVVRTLSSELPPGPWKDLRLYLIVDERGALRRRCDVTTWSVDDELGLNASAVLGGELRELSLSLFTNASGRKHVRESVVAAGLEELPPGDPRLAELLGRLREGGEAGPASPVL
jgi:hypothetical protein